MLDLIAEYYDDAYAYGYDYAENAGYIALANEKLDELIDELNAFEAWVDSNSGEMTDEFKDALYTELDVAKNTI